MKPMQVLEAEHRLIETVVNALGGVAHAIEKDQRADGAMLATAVEFFRIYADKLHHGKEETLFFPMLVKRGVPPQGCPIGGLNHEHEKGRALVKALDDQAAAYGKGQAGARESLLDTLHGVLDLYPNHIWKEDAMVFPMADRVLSDTDQKELCAKFAEADRAIGNELIARLESFARGLATSAPPLRPGAVSQGACGCGCKP